MEEIESLIKARYPLIWLQTFEESRAVYCISQIATLQNKNLYVWASTTGIRDPQGMSCKDGSEDPMGALPFVSDLSVPAIIVFKDLHRFINDITVYRLLRDLHDTLKGSNKSIIIISPVLEIPVELQKSITVINLPLPGPDDLLSVLDNVLKGVALIGESKPEVAALVENIREILSQDGFQDTVLSAGKGLTLDEFENVIAKSIVVNGSIDLDIISGEKAQIIKKSGILEYYPKSEGMEDVGGLEVLKAWIRRKKLTYSQDAKDFGLEPPKGVMLTGPPGTGKTLVAKVIAKSLGVPLLKMDMAKIYGSYVGQSEQNISHALEVADAVAPCVLWLDEVEKALAGASGGGGNDGGVTSRVFGTFLTWLQEHTSEVFVVATSNNPTIIPPEFNRAGRFDEVFMVDLPNETERAAIFKIHLNKKKQGLTEDTYVNNLAKLTPNFSGAEIREVVKSAMEEAFYAGLELHFGDLELAIDDMIPLAEKRKEEIKALRAWGNDNARSASAPETKQLNSTNSTTRSLEL